VRLTSHFATLDFVPAAAYFQMSVAPVGHVQHKNAPDEIRNTPRMKHRWIAREVDDPDCVERLRTDLNDLPEALARALAARGIESREAARRFFRPSREALHDPLRMTGMDAAAARLADAIDAGERVLVYGDYDVDGTTATALMTRFLRAEGLDTDYFVPDRFEHGYGLCRAGLDHAAEQDAALVVALDCGVTAVEQAQYARSRDLDLIICDHHTPAPGEDRRQALPDALAVLDPKRTDCDYPFGALCGCGVGAKLAQATLQERGASTDEAAATIIDRYGDLLALAVAADIVPVQGENRIFLREGLQQMRSSDACPGLRTLADEADLDLSGVTGGRLVFTLGPRINAAGRLDRADRAVDLLLSETDEDARPFAETLDEINTRRRTLDRDIEQEAARRAERRINARSPHALVLADEDWHQGVVGIAASSVVERFYRPTVLVTTAGDEAGELLKGSARSISGVNVYDAIAGCSELLEQFGGHDHAAGLTLRRANLDAFRECFDEAVGAQVEGSPELLRPVHKVDAPLALDEIGALDDRFWAVLRQFAPHGPANARPVFHARDLALAQSPRRVGSEGKHLKFTVRPGEAGSGGDGQAGSKGATLDAIAFGMGDKIDVLNESRREGRPLELLFSVEENTYRGRTSLQLKVRDVRLQEDGSRFKQRSRPPSTSS
jgi:single-stranded-DNA-specific exonuclease